jgi:hypothetical protein
MRHHPALMANMAIQTASRRPNQQRSHRQRPWDLKCQPNCFHYQVRTTTCALAELTEFRSLQQWQQPPHPLTITLEVLLGPANHIPSKPLIRLDK